MDTEQSEIVEGADPPQQETVIEKEPVSKMESPADVETPATNDGDHEQVNGHSEVENGIGTEHPETQEEPKTEESIPEVEAEPSPSKEDMGETAGKEAESNQGDQEDKPVETPENESVPEPVTVQEPVETQPEKEEENVAVEQKEKDGVAESAASGDEKVDEKPADEVKEKSDAAEAEMTPTAAAEEVKTDVQEQEVEEDPTPVAGSLAFAILEQEATKDMLKTTRTLVVLRGLPGSGKSFLARAIGDTYGEHGAVISANDHDVKPESPDGYKAFDDAIVAKCSGATSPVLVVVDDTNHTQDRLAHLGGIAKQHQLIAVFLEPRTQWSRDAAELAKKTKRGLEPAKLEAMKKPHEEMSIPLFFGWFLFFTVQDKVREMSASFLKTLQTLESFKQHLSDFNIKEGEELNLEQYFKAKGILHCTTKYTNYGKADGAKEYTEKKVVQEMYSSVSDLSLSALFITPRTVGAQVSLTEDQLQLWPDDAEKEAESEVPGAGALSLGSRAHVTLGCTDGVRPVQTGFDLLQILLLQKDEQQEKTVEETESGTLTYYGEGRWYLALKEPISASACFSSSYKAKAPGPVKKEKKKPKCTIL